MSHYFSFDTPDRVRYKGSACFARAAMLSGDLHRINQSHSTIPDAASRNLSAKANRRQRGRNQNSNTVENLLVCECSRQGEKRITFE